MSTPSGGRLRQGLKDVALPAVVLLVVATGGVGLWARGDLNTMICDGECGPTSVVPPQTLAGPIEPAHGTDDPPTGGIDGTALLDAVEPALKADALGPRVGFIAVDPAGGGVLAIDRGNDAFVPASTTKLLTSFAALSVLAPDRRFATRVMADGANLTLVGGGDPYLTIDPAKKSNPVARGDLTSLAKATARRLKLRNLDTVTVRFDDRLFVGPDENPTWERSYVRAHIVTRISPLWVDRGLVVGSRVSDPAAYAAEEFARLLRAEGIKVDGEPSRGRAMGSRIAVVRSAPVAAIVENLLLTSDNEAAEVMLRQAAIANGREGSFAGGVATVEAVLDSAGVSTSRLVLHDGSGLSRANRITPTTLTSALVAALKEPRTAAIFGDLPVAGYSGSLAPRFGKFESSQGLVRAKTGTLTGVHSLAGVATLSDGRPVVFAVMVDRTGKRNPFVTQDALDAVLAALVACPCQVLAA